MTTDPLPNITEGMAALRRDNPWPDLPVGVDPFYLSLDGGGRSLITDLIREHEITLMLEVGCFLCGSTRQWLNASPTLQIVGVDPWDGNWSVYVRLRSAEGSTMMDTLENPEEIANTIQRHGNFALAMNNIRDERERFTPVRQRSPEALRYLKRRQILPELIYIDALKSDEDLWVAHEVFPRSILCGDDWTWRDEDGRYLMRDHVQAFAAEKDFDVRAEGATWLITPRAQQGVPVRPRKRQAWDAESAERLVAELDADALELVRVVAAAIREGTVVTFDDVSRRLGCDRPALLHAIQRLNDAAKSLDRKQVLGLGGPEGDGWESVGPRPFSMASGLADLLPAQG
jgi:hypothetical protein